MIVIITDGDDTFSRADLNDVIDIAQRTETTIFGISTKGGFLGSVPGVEAGTVKDKGDKMLTQLCEETGGEAFFPGDMLGYSKRHSRGSPKSCERSTSSHITRRTRTTTAANARSRYDSPIRRSRQIQDPHKDELSCDQGQSEIRNRHDVKSQLKRYC